MKNLLVIAVILVGAAAQAATYKCSSTEEGFEPAYSITIGEVIETGDLTGHKFKARDVSFTKRDVVTVRYTGVGVANKERIDLRLLAGDDLAFGTLSAKAYGTGMYSGEISVVGYTGEGPIQVVCFDQDQFLE